MSGEKGNILQLNSQMNDRENQVSVSKVLDLGREALEFSWEAGREPSDLLVHPTVFDAICRAKMRELARGHLLSVMGLCLVPCDELAPEESTVR